MAIAILKFLPSQRGKVIGMFMTMVGIGAVGGPVVSGVVVDFLEGVADLSPGQTGLLMSFTMVMFAIVGPISGRLSDRYGPKRFEYLGLAMLFAGMLILGTISESSRLYVILLGLIFQGVRMGTFNPPNQSSVLGTVDLSRIDVATAFTNMVRNTANVTGIGLAVTIVTM